MKTETHKLDDFVFTYFFGCYLSLTLNQMLKFRKLSKFKVFIDDQTNVAHVGRVQKGEKCGSVDEN